MPHFRLATRDYARPHRPKPAAPNKSRAQPRRPGAKRSGGATRELPLWVWMVVGVSLLIAVFALYSISRPAVPMDMAPSSAGKAPKPQETVEIPPKAPSRFAFYEMLPSYEVVVPEEVLNPAKPKPGSALNNLPPTTAEKSNAVASVGSSAMATAPAEKREPTAAELLASNQLQGVSAESAHVPTQAAAVSSAGGQYLIQVAAFRGRADAEARVAALTLQGLAARVEQVTIDNRDTWYRVRLGPYGSAAAAAAAQQALKAQGYDGVVMRVRS